MSNEWNQPDAPPPPLFIGQPERDLVKQINDELIESVIGQSIIYYPIDIERTNYHDLYGEAVTKTFLPPVRVYALVEFDGITTKYNTNIGLDKELFGQIDHLMEISAKCIKAREGLFDAT